MSDPRYTKLRGWFNVYSQLDRDHLYGPYPSKEAAMQVRAPKTAGVRYRVVYMEEAQPPQQAEKEEGL